MILAEEDYLYRNMPNDSLELTVEASAAFSAFSLRLVYLIALLFDDLNQRRRAFFPFRPHPSFGSRVRLEPCLDRFGHQHESAAIRCRISH